MDSMMDLVRFLIIGVLITIVTSYVFWISLMIRWDLRTSGHLRSNSAYNVYDAWFLTFVGFTGNCFGTLLTSMATIALLAPNQRLGESFDAGMIYAGLGTCFIVCSLLAFAHWRATSSRSKQTLERYRRRCLRRYHVVHRLSDDSSGESFTRGPFGETVVVSYPQGGHKMKALRYVGRILFRVVRPILRFYEMLWDVSDSIGYNLRQVVSDIMHPSRRRS